MRYAKFRDDSLSHANLTEEIHSSTSASSKCANHENFDVIAAAAEHVLNMLNHCGLILVRIQTA